MKKLIVIFVLAVFACNVMAQKHSDISLNVFTVLSHSQAELSYEQSIAKKWDIILGVGYGWKPRYDYHYTPIDSMLGVYSTHTIDRTRYSAMQFSAFLGAKYYWFPKKGGDRLTTAVFVDLDTYSLEEGAPFIKTEPSLGFACEVTYKWCIWKERLILETGLRYTISQNYFLSNPLYPYALDVSNGIIGRIGYRF